MSAPRTEEASVDAGELPAAARRQGPWDLSDLLPEPSREEIDRRIAALERRVEALEGRRHELSPEMEPAAFEEIFALYEEISERMIVLGAYGTLWFSSDTQSGAALAYRNRIEQLLTNLGNRTLFLSLWWKGLDEGTAAALVPEDPDRRHYLEDLRRLRPYTLEERSEQIVNLKDANGVGGLMTLYSMLTNRLEYHLEVDGEELTLTRDQLTGYVFSPRPELREAAYREALRVAEGEAGVLAQIYVHRVRDWRSENVELRGFASPLAVRNAANDLPDEAVEALLEVTAEGAGVFRRYFRLKAGWLGMERLRRFDLYAPLTAAERSIEWPRAVELVLETFRRFDHRFAAHAERVFGDDHIDSEVRKGKKGGAFCATVLPRHTPWVMVNYTGKVRDVATLAHELGHAVHSMLAEDHSALAQHPSLPLAETASVFSEILLTDRLLREESAPAVRRELLASALDDIYATVLRQAFFVRFEVAAHEAIRDGAAPEELDRLYFATLEEQFGDSLELDPAFRHEWVAIPHIFHTPFYCYAYSFGQLLVLALYRRYQKEGEGFVPGYLELLARGGSARPAEMLSAIGVDVGDPEFWRGGFRVIADMVDEAERTAG